LISFEDFKKFEMRVVQVINAESIPGRDKILKLQLDIGIGGKRTIVVGGAQFYKPEEFVGKKFIAVVNLLPREVAGVNSEGMILATDTEKPFWITVDSSAPIGSRIV
jgi:tRNA-binding protein